MPTHYKDKTRDTTDRKPGASHYRLFGVDDNGETYFYWSETPGQFGGFFGPVYDAVWGKLTHKTTMLPENRVFIEDMEMVQKLENFGIMRPCGGCQRAEYRIWQEKIRE